MDEIEFNKVLQSGKNANSIFTILGQKLAHNELNWLTSRYPDIPPKEALYLYIHGLTKPPTCVNPKCSNKPKFLGYTRGYRIACGISCSRIHDYATRGNEIVTKAKNTLLSRYNATCPYEVSGWTEAMERNRLANIGRHHSPKTLAKIKATNLERFGAENPMGSKLVQQKTAKTMQERYGGYYLGVYGPKRRHEKWQERKRNWLRAEFEIELIDDKFTAGRQKCKCLKCGKIYTVNLANGKVSRCPDCFFVPASRSRAEKELSEFVRGLGFRVITNAKSKELIYPYTLDIWVPELKLAIEYNGTYWHSEERVGRDYHLRKTELCEAKGIKLLHVFEHLYESKHELVKARIAHICGFASRQIYS